MSLKGNFETFYLNSIFQLLSDDRKTGVLRVTDGNKEIRVYFLDGDIIYAMGSQKQDRLGVLLKKQGIISQEQLRNCLAKGKEEKKALGKILVEQGYISEEKLSSIIYQQTEEMVFNLFLWDKGQFEYKDSKLNLKGMIVTRLKVVKLLLEASRRIDEISVIKKQIPNDRLVFRRSDRIQNKDEIKLNSNEWQILGLIDGKQTVRRVIDASDFDEYSTYKIIHSLLSSGLIEKSDATYPNKTEVKSTAENDYSFIITVYNDLLQVMFRNLESELGKKMHTIFNECKPSLTSATRDIFVNFHPNQPIATHISQITQALNPIQDYKKGCTILINSFNEFILNIVKEVLDILGPKYTLDLVKEIEAILPQVNIRQVDSSEKRSIINKIKKVLVLANVQIQKGR